MTLNNSLSNLVVTSKIAYVCDYCEMYEEAAVTTKIYTTSNAPTAETER